LKNNLLEKESFIKADRLLTDDHSCRPFVETIKVTTRSETVIESVERLFMALKFEIDMKNNDIVKQ
jgi:hypothetical protein